ncbi:MAG: hypothetical protein Q4P18_06220 [Methanobrevibacter sp.]|uniref:hypothetical protein n=1 Tax=Methanobrevibacter sp. TaxID=66852 RepID=UPI0026E0B5BD|nr:hypothetical protein [Methanobrevibacter sp.]MDO5849109.1 hypothetical protein [Methanobrevibacter sp.]
MKINWKIKFGIGLLIVSCLLYGFAFFFLNEPDKVFFYIVIDSAFVPIDILVVVLVIESIIEKKEKEAVLDKLDMILGVFFSEIGNNLLEMISRVNSDNGEIIKKLKNIDKWDDDDFKHAYKYLKTNGVSFTPEIPENEVQQFVRTLQHLLKGKRPFLIDLLENPNIIEKVSFSNLLLAMFHLDDELELRRDLDQVGTADFEHIIGDIDRVYCRLTYEWIKYLQFLNNHYPYMSSLTMRVNPFNPETNVYITD